MSRECVEIVSRECQESVREFQEVCLDPSRRSGTVPLFTRALNPGRWQVTEIDLSNNLVVGWPMNMLQELPALTILNATDNPLTCAPEGRTPGLLIPTEQFDSTPECGFSMVRLMLASACGFTSSSCTL